MPFKAKLRKIGSSLGVLIPKDVITSYNVGDEIELNVITKDNSTADVITPESATITGKLAGIGVGRCRYCLQPLGQPSPQCNRHGVA